MIPEGQGGGHKAEKLFLHLYIGKNNKMKHLANFSQIGTNISCMMGIHVFQMKVQVLFKGEENTKVQK
jgi:hypothetical protein